MSKPDDESQDRPRRSSDGHKRPRGSGHGPRTQRGERSFGDRSRGGKGFQRSDRRRDDRRDGQRWDNRRDDRRGGKDFRRDERRGGKDFRRDERRGGKDFRRAERKRNDRERGGTRRERRHEPPIPEGITGKELHSETRRQLRPLEKSNADVVAKHLVAAGQLVDAAPEVAYEHAQAALGRAARIGAVREAVGIVAYQLEKYGEALRELRTHRRITGSNDNAALMADCERGRGNPRKALEVAAEFEAAELDPAVRIELLIVKAGAYSDLGDNATAKEILSSAGFTGHPAGATVRLLSAYADLLRVDGETELADKYEQLARRTAKLKNVMYGDEEPDPNADVEIMTIHEIPDEELAEPVADGADENEDPAPGEDPEAGDAAAEPATASGAADEAPSSEESDGTAAEGTAAHDAEPAEAPAAEPEQPVAANLSFADEVEAELQELLIEAGIESDAGTQPDGGEEPPQEETLF